MSNKASRREKARKWAVEVMKVTEDLGYTKRMIARRLDVSERTVRRWQNGTTELSASDMLGIEELAQEAYAKAELEVRRERERERGGDGSAGDPAAGGAGQGPA